ncbi:YciI family protein [Rhizobium leguminosarum]|uniref:YciI family protein n=1 Tax=Rhizobium leguminosarum TaxID=384 RepID=UPI001C967B6A|nr:YciI family protein [Rhizobium leguminosarum]MBY5364183.1 YciI family protein [Rhizobium leguminosarum]MBY5411940.1 YciI family protein [Rhizobium leguminosarum]
MRFVCLIYNSADTDGTLSQAEGDELVRAHFQYDEELQRKGIMIHSDALEGPDCASVLRVRDGTLSSTDGPYIETKEHLAGIYIIEAADLEDAREVVAGIPSVRVGSIELRPVRLLTLPQ